MPFTDRYRRQVQLLVRLLPFVAQEPCFALKGGTAINLFVRDMPRLSVDIDLAYLPVMERDQSLAEIGAALARIAANARANSPAEDVREVAGNEGAVTRLVARGNGVQVMVEVTPVLRGCAYPPQTRVVSPMVEETFGFAEMQVVSFADLYGGKIVAALDRQHPRDLYDVRDLLANEGIDHALRCAFLVYLISHNRPMAEVLAPRRKDIETEFERAFVGMTEEAVALEELIETRERLIELMVGGMPTDHRAFLLSFKRGAPDWALLGLQGIGALPAVRWRLQNLAALSEAKRRELAARLEGALNLAI